MKLENGKHHKEETMLNKVLLIANLTRDPEARRTNSGTSVCKLGLAVNRRYKDSHGNTKDDTTFIDCDVWGNSADFCRDYLRKGNRVMVEGRLKMDSWEDRTTGQKRSRLGVTAENVQNLSPREQQPQQGYQEQRPPQQPAPQQAPPPPFPSQAAGGPPGTPSGGSHLPRPAHEREDYRPPQQPQQQSFDVGDESIDDIPFNHGPADSPSQNDSLSGPGTINNEFGGGPCGSGTPD
jgi:single-strand DNA-binding protein